MKKISVIVILAFTSFLLFQACEEEGGDKVNISSLSSNNSHNAGKNCFSCHKSGGEGKGWFQSAGTVYDSSGSKIYPNAIVKLYTGKNGTGELVKTIEVDKKGNFYTTEDIDFSVGLYPTIEGANSTKHMSIPTFSGSCNSCHGVNEVKLTIN